MGKEKTTIDFDHAKDLGIFISQLVKDGVGFHVEQGKYKDTCYWIVTLTGRCKL